MHPVQLTDLQLVHAEAMFRWMNDGDIARNIGLRTAPSLERTHQWLTKAIRADDIRGFAISVGERHVGNVVLDQIDSMLGTCRLSIYLGEPEMRGRGVGRTAVEQACRYAFDRLKLAKVWLTVHERNLAALRSYQSIGFVVEGVLRREFLLAGERLDALRMGLLAGELTSNSCDGIKAA
jgi:RimJ/RimL family protein N-acetyltransferase